VLALLALPIALAADPSGPIRALYPLHGPDMSFELLGINEGSAVLWRDGKVYAVDVNNGKATSPGAVPKDDLPRWGMVIGPGPWWNRDYQPRVQPIADTGTYAARVDGSLVWLDAAGSPLATLVYAYNLDQKERISPAGDRVAWVRYLGASERYSVIAKALTGDGEKDTRIADGDGFPMAGPIWSADGASLYLTSILHKEACLVRADTEPLMELWELQCVGGVQGGSLAMAPDGKTAAFIVHKNTASAEVWWVDLPGGDVRSKTKVGLAGARTTELLLDDSGLLLARGSRGKGVVAVDLAAGTSASTDAGYTYDGLGASAWVAPGVAIGIRRTPDSADVVRIDARAILATAKN
jgi:hypothetical protein